MIKKRVIIISSFLYGSVIHAFSGHPFIAYRPVGMNNARMFAGCQELRTDLFANRDDGIISGTLEYTRSFSPNSISEALFGCKKLVFSGSRAANRGSRDILADYFGLPTDFKSTVSFEPRVENVIADVDWYWSFRNWCKGLYLHVNMPLTHTIWNLNACEKKEEDGVLNYPAGYMSPERIDRAALPHSALEALSGTVTFGDLETPLAYGRICGKQKATKLADILVALGYVSLEEENYYLGFDAQVVIPTGTRSHARTLFEPQIGNGGHWGLGVSISGYCSLWQNEQETCGVGLYLDGDIQHLFATTQKRSFDLKNGPGSRYMLLEDIGKQVVGLYVIDDRVFSILNFNFVSFENYMQADNQYHARLFHAIDKTTFDTKIRINVQADLALKLAGHWHNWDAALGYNFFARSRETLMCRDKFPSDSFAVKGDAQVYGYQVDGEISIFIGINATQSEATLHAGQGSGNANLNFTNTNADNADAIFLVDTPLSQSTINGLQGTGVSTISAINGSHQAILLDDADINNCSGVSPRILSHKIFSNFGYTWYDDEKRATPFLGVGSEVEFSGKTHSIKTAISQWGIWLQLGTAY